MSSLELLQFGCHQASLLQARRKLAMFVIVRRYTGAGPDDEMARHAQQDVIPMLREQSGFRAFFALATDDGSFVSISIFNDREAALAANERIVSWVEENLSDLVPNPPEIAFGEVLFPEVVPEQPDKNVPYIAIATYDGITQPPESVMPKTRKHLIPVIKQQAGFQGMYNFRSEANPSRSVSVGVFDNKEAADAAYDFMAAIMQEKFGDIFPHPPKRTSGIALIAMTA
jgi:heme-degrading monooxygenase HmoA